jgi:hypothetical protein
MIKCYTSSLICLVEVALHKAYIYMYYRYSVVRRRKRLVACSSSYLNFEPKASVYASVYLSAIGRIVGGDEALKTSHDTQKIKCQISRQNFTLPDLDPKSNQGPSIFHVTGLIHSPNSPQKISMLREVSVYV